MAGAKRGYRIRLTGAPTSAIKERLSKKKRRIGKRKIKKKESRGNGKLVRHERPTGNICCNERGKEEKG